MSLYVEIAKRMCTNVYIFLFIRYHFLTEQHAIDIMIPNKRRIQRKYICCAIDLQSLCQHAKGSRWWFKCGGDGGVNFVVVLMSWWWFKGGEVVRGWYWW